MLPRRSFIPTVILTGLLVGTLDIISACTHFMIATGDKSFTKVLVFVASGFFGKTAFSAGPAMAWWGLLFHYIIAFSFTLLFFLVYPKAPALRKYPVVTGLVYGLLVWCAMEFLVLPMSNIPPRHYRIANTVIGISILMVMIGLPLSLVARKFYGDGNSGDVIKS
ncbi:hypothetical protein CLV51_105220 [Chitinophaga niastensis]|uniref:DUF1440 domain-containing protein n=1 Tax=Chitinophaga niastensis TaxID=536980 RepID=A0A2P8HF47_CHINA|nr:DUF1440 domain-containing protein [Chitinophaga niastensis]PSL44847.1 hypothetical protein CLV51_105220 [Chitinophaga niastensis]